MSGGPAIECVTLKEGPPGVESQADVETVVQPLCRYVRSRDNDAQAFVVACFSDPGLFAAREATRHPVFGIAECGLLKALTLGERFGIIAILERSIPRHQRYVRMMGLDSRFAAELSIGLGIRELGDDAKAFARMEAVGRTLHTEHGANVVVMGCAGMARFRDRLEDAIGVPVVEPTLAATTMALGAIRLGW
jgi:Asp/Glu/hydantoin racemase